MDLDALALFLRLLSTVAGLILLYGAFFLYPGERENLQSKLEEWWVRLDDAKQRAHKGEPVFIRGIAETAHRGFSLVFGEPFSARFFLMSALLSMISFSLALSVVADYGWAVPTGLLIFALLGAWFVSTAWDVQRRFATDMEILERRSTETFRTYNSNLFGSDLATRFPELVARPLPREKTSWEKSWWDDLPQTVINYLPIILLTSSSGLVLAGAKAKGAGSGVFIMSGMTAFTADVISITVTMLILEKLKTTRTSATASAWLLLDAVVAAALLLIPFALFLWVVDQQSTLGRYSLFVASSNISTAAPSVAYVAVAMALLLHRVFWPLLVRPIYGVVAGKKIISAKVLAFAGITLLVTAWPQVFTPFKPLLDPLADLF